MLFNIKAEKIPVDQAKQVAKNVFYEHFNVKQNKLNFDIVYTNYSESAPLYYVFNRTQDEGFVIVSADDRVLPVLAYSNESNYTNNNFPVQFVSWMEHYSIQIKYAIENDLQADKKILSQWSKYNVSASLFEPDKNLRNVDPLLGDIIWDQDEGWNDYCPTDPDGPGGHVYAGCVATAAGQVMKYWNYPQQGEGSHTYNPSGYPSQTANFGNTTYEWDNMAEEYDTDEAALLLWHLGISVDMQYGPDGSGAYTDDLVYSFENYFKYKNTADFKSKSWHSDWDDMLKDELDEGRPMVYQGVDGYSGHAFVCDGYDGNEFHFNWGWSGSYNGYFTTDNLNPSSYQFNSNQGAIFGVEPAITLYPPTNLQAQIDENDVTLSWESPDNKGLQGFKVYRDDQAITGVLPASLFVFTDSNLDNGTYTYCVKAIYDSGTSNCSNEETVEIDFSMTPPQNLQASVNQNDVTLSWESPNSKGINGYKVFRDDEAISGLLPPTLFVFSDSNLENGLYTYCVKAKYKDGMSDCSNYKSVNINYTSIKQKNNDFIISPNPVNNSLKIVSEKNKIEKIIISDISGKTVYRKENINTKSKTIDFSNLDKGLYLLKINISNNEIHKKIIKN